MHINLREYALTLLRNGAICCPVLPGSKFIDFVAMGWPADSQPNAVKTRRKMAHTATAVTLAMRGVDQARVAEWFNQAGNQSNIGLVAGHNNLVVLDFDDERLFKRFAHRHASLCASTPVEKTPNGYHVYLRSDVEVFCTALYIDGHKAGHISGVGGFVTCAPSVLSDGRTYRWLPGQSFGEMQPMPIGSLATLGVSTSRWRSLVLLAKERLRPHSHGNSSRPTAVQHSQHSDLGMTS
jgi:hypothetical protein